MAQLSGISRDEALGHKLFALLPADFEKNLAAHLVEAFCAPRIIEGEFSQRHEENEIFSFLYRVAKIDTDGLRGAVMVSLIDKSERDRLHRQLKKQSQFSTVGKLSSGIAGELATPLENICNTIDRMLVAKDPAPEALTKGLHRVLDEVYRISHLTNNIVALAQNDMSVRMPVNVHEIILECIEQLEQKWGRRPVCNVRLDCRAALVVGDPILLQCVMRNLLASAIEAAGDDAVPLIATMDEGVQSVIIRIEDRGAPGAAKAIQQIFTASTTAKNVELGSELGMFVAQKIIEAHKGEIKAEDYVGRGTVYTIALPATDGVEAARMNAG